MAGATADITLVRPDGYIAYAAPSRNGGAALAGVRVTLERQTEPDPADGRCEDGLSGCTVLKLGGPKPGGTPGAGSARTIAQLTFVTAPVAFPSTMLWTVRPWSATTSFRLSVGLPSPGMICIVPVQSESTS